MNREISDSWIGWHNIWHLTAIPLVKFFIWKMTHGKLPSGAYLYNIRVCPYIDCKFCVLEAKTTPHVLWNCCKICSCWLGLLTSLGLNLQFMNIIKIGDWLNIKIKSWAKDAFVKPTLQLPFGLFGKQDAIMF